MDGAVYHFKICRNSSVENAMKWFLQRLFDSHLWNQIIITGAKIREYEQLPALDNKCSGHELLLNYSSDLQSDKTLCPKHQLTWYSGLAQVGRPRVSLSGMLCPDPPFGANFCIPFMQRAIQLVDN
ncbi:hypothetical protein AVEN_200293-1 [Araneus ventricosus]|uniref:Uncharacterized protein n=1 Tax=Araneus ventricosus TaxID=182803 RepID=A0A4Y2HHS2_ARAVE|nr:hypothetical protein AVEN_200293-1 [Araneus ventricosus]